MSSASLHDIRLINKNQFYFYTLVKNMKIKLRNLFIYNNIKIINICGNLTREVQDLYAKIYKSFKIFYKLLIFFFRNGQADARTHMEM